MKTLTIDNQQRHCIPNAKPRQVFRYHRYRGGVSQLVPVGDAERGRGARAGHLADRA